MNIKKSLENRVRGWLPKTPNLPKQPSAPSFERTANYQQAQTVFAVKESKIKENAWFLMGAGFVILPIGLFTALWAYFLYDSEMLALTFGKIPADNPLFSELPGLIASCLIVAAGGGVAGVLGYLIDYKQSVKEFFYRARPYRSKGNKLFKVGVALSLFALILFSGYLVSPSSLQLWFTAVTVSIGLCALISGILILNRR